MAKFSIIPGEDDHVVPLIGNLRSADKKEVLFLTGRDPDEVLIYSWRLPYARWSIWMDADVVGVFGVTPVSYNKRVATPWLLGSSRVTEMGKSFLISSGVYIDQMLHMYEHLYNYVHVDNVASKRWLTYFGFDILAAEPVGIRGELFNMFYKRGRRNV